MTPIDTPARSARPRGHDSASCGDTFVTVVTRDREPILGAVQDAVFLPSAAGTIVRGAWSDLPRLFPFVRLDAFVIMPNHLHGVLTFLEPEDRPSGDAPERPGRAHLDIVVQAFKSISTLEVNRALRRRGTPLWQRGHFGHRVGNEGELQRIRDYIHGNPGGWADDRYHPSRAGSSPLPP